jgi:hypothetical protein
MQVQSDAAEIAADPVPTIRGKQRLQTLAHLDQRTRASRRAHELVAAFEAEIGSKITTSQRLAIERAAMLTAIAEDAKARRLAGEAISINDIVRADGAAHRALKAVKALGNDQRAKPDGRESLAAYIAAKHPGEATPP